MSEIVFLLEEASAKACLEGLLPRVFGNDLVVRYLVFEGKQDLEKNIVRKVRAYRNPDARFLVVRDKDAVPNFLDLKKRLHDLCVEAGRPESKVRIFCHELETIYLGDLLAVERGLELKPISHRQGERKFREPDRIASPSSEMKSLTGGKYQKVGGSRAIGPHLNVLENKSPSFHALLSGVRELIAV